PARTTVRGQGSGGPAAGRPARLEVVGDLDLAGAARVRAAVLAAAGTGGDLELDLTGTSYLASAGLTLLADAAERAAAGGGKLTVVVRPAGQVARALAVTGLDGPIAVCWPDRTR
ncbi:MAG TPA: STAS domain-containing protein, partial [Pseudonocardia sp.]|nr:STAS domain-containing protein [Pseudonocardia sp.]